VPRPPAALADPAVERLLRDLGPRLRRGDAPVEPWGRLPTGLVEIDRLLGGGLQRGCLCEIAGPPSSGRTSLGLSLLARATAAEEVCAWVDAADGFDPPSAEAAGAVLERVLWARPGPGARGASEALRCAERLVETGGFALVLLDLSRREREVPRAAWARLARAAEASGSALLVLSQERAAGSQAAVALELSPARACFGGMPLLLEALEIEAVLVRQRGAPAERTALLRLAAA
jgi:RecA/RadA recombinase